MECDNTKDKGNVKYVVLISVLAVYTVLCGIVIADCGTSAVAGRTRQSIVQAASGSILKLFDSKPQAK